MFSSNIETFSMRFFMDSVLLTVMTQIGFLVWVKYCLSSSTFSSSICILLSSVLSSKRFFTPCSTSEDVASTPSFPPTSVSFAVWSSASIIPWVMRIFSGSKRFKIYSVMAISSLSSGASSLTKMACLTKLICPTPQKACINCCA